MSLLRLGALTFLLGACDPGAPPPAPPDPAVHVADEATLPTADPVAPGPAATMGGVVCDGPTGMPNMLAGIRPANPTHHVELRKIMPGDDGPVGESVSSVGTACTGATSTQACEAKLAATLPDKGFGFGCRPLSCHEVLVFTRGDEVGAVDALAAVPAFLGPIDTLGEALLMLRAHEYQSGTCEEITAGKVTQTDEGFVAKVAKRIADCPVQYADYELLVAPSGEVSVITETKRPMGKQKMCI